MSIFMFDTMLHFYVSHEIGKLCTFKIMFSKITCTNFREKSFFFHFAYTENVTTHKLIRNSS